MEISEVAAQYPVVGRTSYLASASVAFATDLTLKTKEGDLVELSFQNEQSLTESETQSRLADDVAIREISSVAVAASRYSISVQGDLNEEELDAIERLVDGIAPIARGFFAQGEFDFQNATEVLAGSLGPLEDIQLELERVITATFSTEVFSTNTPVQAFDPGSIALTEPSQESINPENIRNLSDLVFSAVQAEFESQAAQLPKDEAILRSLNDLIVFLQEQLGQILTPLKNTAEPGLKPLPLEIGGGFTPPEETSA